MLHYSRADIRFKDGAKDDLKNKTRKFPDVDLRYAGRASEIRCRVTGSGYATNLLPTIVIERSFDGYAADLSVASWKSPIERLSIPVYAQALTKASAV